MHGSFITQPGQSRWLKMQISEEDRKHIVQAWATMVTIRKLAQRTNVQLTLVQVHIDRI